MNFRKNLSILDLGILIVLFFLGAFLGLLICVLFFDKKPSPPENIHQISLTTTLETKIPSQEETEEKLSPTVLTHEDAIVEKISLINPSFEKPILDFIKKNIDFEDFAISKVSDEKYKITSKIPDVNTVIELIPSLKNYSFFIKPFVGKKFTVYITVLKKSSDIIHCEIEKMRIDRLYIRKNMIKNFISFADFEIKIPKD